MCGARRRRFFVSEVPLYQHGHIWCRALPPTLVASSHRGTHATPKRAPTERAQIEQAHTSLSLNHANGSTMAVSAEAPISGMSR